MNANDRAKSASRKLHFVLYFNIDLLFLLIRAAELGFDTLLWSPTPTHPPKTNISIINDIFIAITLFCLLFSLQQLEE